MATRKVYPTSYVLENVDDKDETNERSASRVGKSLDEDESDEEAAGIATRAHRKRVEAGLQTANAKEFFLKRLVIALIILVILLVVIVVSLVIALVKSKCKESEAETGTHNQQASFEKLQGTAPSDETMDRVNALEVNMTRLKQDLEEKTRDSIFPRQCFLRSFEAKCKETDELELKMENILKSVNASLSTINSTLFQELISVGTDFESKTQNISQRLEAAVIAINRSFSRELSSLRTTFSSKIQNISEVQGSPGLPGPPGLNGSKGDIGQQGAQGPMGEQGLQGDKGEPGDKGDRGANGTDGSAGQKGDIGPPGTRGEPGIKGDRGANGTDGVTGQKGDKGLPGSKGETGVKGDAGINGTDGANGTKGDQGVRGEKGDSGVKGEAGVNGTDGAAGLKGDTGPQGDKGDLGPQGLQGSKGEIGPQGAQGAGNFSQCSYKEEQGTPVSPGASAEAEVFEIAGKKILGVSCSTNNAAEYNLQRVKVGQQYKYLCTCRGTSTLFLASGMWCKVHYWECPLTT